MATTTLPPGRTQTPMQWLATCTDCSWRYQDSDQEAAADALERHARKERHRVDIRRRAVA
ncbi:hypothetical protein HSRCO_1872 [Halanaeroarchaeum sp. HSR-CO]|nr:hypothetical protein HSRCO_1872 [Halanaeroarchaeum sp. HSR-CO]